MNQQVERAVVLGYVHQGALCTIPESPQWWPLRHVFEIQFGAAILEISLNDDLSGNPRL